MKWFFRASAIAARQPRRSDRIEITRGPADQHRRGLSHGWNDVWVAIEHVDFLIVGAGLSGIGAGHQFHANFPTKSYAILEARHEIGGTWSLFTYPGVRSDSDMHTLGYRFRPWADGKAIADGPAILDYVRATAREGGVEDNIRFGLRVVRADWSSGQAIWTVEAQQADTGAVVHLTCGFLFMCSGYYRYDAGYLPDFAGIERFGGRIVHPQHWPDDLDYTGKRVVVIGSGATAVTLVPAMAPDAEHVTMLQRSPTYVVARPAEDQFANSLRDYLPSKMAYAITRWRNVLRGMYLYRLCKRDPARVKKLILDGVRAALGPHYNIEQHFTPRYNPWDQRLCLVRDGDLFEAIRAGRASVVTQQIDTFTEAGIKLKSGEELSADLVVTATGLELQPLGGLQLRVDGKRIDLATTMIYKGMMYSDVPNLASAFGYTNASWTLKCDLTCGYVCRLRNHMEISGYSQCTPRLKDASITQQPWVDFSSGYIQRAVAKFPKQGSKRPWRLHQNYIKDIMMLRYGALEDGTLEFVGPRRSQAVNNTEVASRL
jgi:monooxygenase